MKIPVEKRFWKYVDKSTDCWVWKGCRNKLGYGCVLVDGKPQLAHRVSYVLSGKSIPDGLLVCHSCDNPPCVNPFHMFIGTPKENSLDMVKKGRHWNCKGERNPSVKLRQERVSEIRELYSTGKYSSRAIGKLYGVSKTQIMKIVNKVSWQGMPL